MINHIFSTIIFNNNSLEYKINKVIVKFVIKNNFKEN